MGTQGERLQKVRKTLQLSQEQLGKVFNTSKQFVSKIENNGVLLNNQKLEILVRDYNINANYILAGKGKVFL